MSAQKRARKWELLHNGGSPRLVSRSERVICAELPWNRWPFPLVICPGIFYSPQRPFTSSDFVLICDKKSTDADQKWFWNEAKFVNSTQVWLFTFPVMSHGSTFVIRLFYVCFVLRKLFKRTYVCCFKSFINSFKVLLAFTWLLLSTVNGKCAWLLPRSLTNCDKFLLSRAQNVYHHQIFLRI